MDSAVTFEAEDHLTRLLDRVARGERIVITSGGNAVAMLVPTDPSGRIGSAEVGREMLAYRDHAKRSLGDTFRCLAHEGHSY